ncbi:MAG: ribonuclease HII [Candidatus Aminicenantes bacterium]|nr:ribonuclease HII [Candidatus Aminicenantes bacterium]
MASFRIERSFLKRGINYIAGVDEAGRGALVGPVIAAAVILPPEFYKGKYPFWLTEIDDSKSLTPSKREKLKELIFNHALSVGLGGASVREIEKLNIHRASLLAMRRAVSRLLPEPELILIDGELCYLEEISLPQLAIKAGDRLCKSIAAASIIAKVIRDRLMIKLDKICQGYNFCDNKGYGTKAHFEALKKLGPSPFHRRNFNLGIDNLKIKRGEKNER